MRKLSLLALAVVAMVAASFSTASAVPLNGKKGVGYARAIGGTDGLTFNFATGNLIIEGILGVHSISPDDSDADKRTNNIRLGAGVHFQALRADAAALTVGGRLNVGLGNHVAGAPTSVNDDGDDLESVTQIGIDIPVRVYWFPIKYFSMHMETGIAYVSNPEKGSTLAAPGAAGAKGTDIIIGGNGGAGAFGNIGFTFWF
ncbi:MAG: hypothetical protein ACE366_17160 [Bradymonadia bacterium]